MNMTIEETQQLIRDVGAAWASQNPQTARVLTDGDFFLLGKSLGNRLSVVGRLDVSDIDKAIDNFGKSGSSNGVMGRLSFQSVVVPGATPAASATVADAAPYLDEPMLRNLTSVVAVTELTAQQAKMFCTQSAMHGYDERGRKIVSLNQKFNERVAWLRAHPDVVLDFSEPQPQTVVVRKRAEDPRITAIREQIEKESKGYTDYSHRKRERLDKTLNELLRDPSRQVYRDRSRGGIELIKGLDAIERIMRDVIRDYDSPFK